MKFSRQMAIYLVTCICLLTATDRASFGAASKGDSEYESGIKAYKAKDYQGAADHFGNALKAGKQSAALWLYSGYCFTAMGHKQRACQAFDVVLNSFKDSPEANLAKAQLDVLRPGSSAMAGAAAAAAAPGTPGAATPPAAGAPAAPGAAPKPLANGALPNATGLAARVTVIAPGFHHPAVSAASLAAIQEAIAALPKPLRKALDENGTCVCISPNMIDRWPESIKDLPENDPAETLAELPGRIYGKEMCVYERAKTRFTTNLKEARTPRFIKQQVLNMCFQQLDDLQNISKDPALRAAWEADKEKVPDNAATKLATFMKEDDWGPRETCSELFGSILGAGDDNTEYLYRYFPQTKKWLIAKLNLK